MPERSLPLRLVRALILVLFLALLGLVAFSGLERNVYQGMVVLTGQWWGVTTLVDLYVGLAFVGLWIYALERSVAAALKWGVALLLLGNVATLVYLYIRAGRVRTVRELLVPGQVAA